MGYRLHVAKCYKVEYNAGGAFNHNNEEINDLIAEYCPMADFNCEEIEFANVIEVERDELKRGIQKMRDDAAKNGSALYLVDLADTLERFEAESDQTNDFVRLEWF